LSQNRACLNKEAGQNHAWTDSDAGLNAVRFPVVLGDLDDLDDGLVGFFVGAEQGGYDLGTFFCAAAAAEARTAAGERGCQPAGRRRLA